MEKGKSVKVNQALAKLESGDSTVIETITKNLDVILDEDSLFAEELRILGQEIQAGEISQVGLDDLEAGELDAEIDQTVKGKTTTKTEQIGTKGVRVTGKATIKIKKNIDKETKMLEDQAQALKSIVKEVLHELLLQERETLTDVIYEVIEDIALAKAIEEGLDDENVSREEIFGLHRVSL